MTNPETQTPEILTSTRVEGIFKQSLTELDNPNHVVVEAIRGYTVFDRDKIEYHGKEIDAMLNELPDTFHEGKGDGWSFLSACEDRHGRLWTGLHGIMDQLFTLGIAYGRVECLLPRDLWSVLPGNMPYYKVRAERGDVQEVPESVVAVLSQLPPDEVGDVQTG